MIANAVTANCETANERKRSSEGLSVTELDAVSGGWSISFGSFKITGGDIVDAAKWAYHHVVK